MIAVALVAIGLNATIGFWLHAGAKHDLNIRSVYWHMVGEHFGIWRRGGGRRRARERIAAGRSDCFVLIGRSFCGARGACSRKA